MRYRVFFLAMALLFALGLPAWAALSDDPLTQLETRLLSRTYPQESTEARLSRLEQNVYGSPVKNKTPEARMDAIESLIPVVPQTPRRNLPGTAASGSPTSDPGDIQSAFEQPKTPMASDDSDYPAITMLESKVFGDTYEHLAVEARLDQLELKTLGRMQRGTLQERTDQLRMTVLGDPDGGLGNTTPGDDTSDSGHNSYSSGSSPSAANLSASERADLEQALMTTENRLLRQTYPSDSLENRLGRLETHLFNQTAPEMSPQDRLYRIAGVISAQKSAKNEQLMPGSSGGRAPSAMSFGNIILMLLMSLL